MQASKGTLNPRMVFWKCGACSHALFQLLDHEFDNVKPLEEKASDILAGGIAQKGHQCGMLWGGSLALGAQVYRSHGASATAIAMAIEATREVVDSFQKRTRHINCRDIVRIDWENKFQFALYMLKTILQGFVFSPCMNLIAKWTPEAIAAARKGMAHSSTPSQPCVSCASEVVRKMGGTEEHAIMVAGFAGGIGLSGYGCGALGAAIWYKMVQQSMQNPDISPSLFNNQDAKKMLRALYRQTDSEVMCANICQRKFNSVAEHTAYITGGGCKHIIDALAQS
jgi:hypothetical protein